MYAIDDNGTKKFKTKVDTRRSHDKVCVLSSLERCNRNDQEYLKLFK